MTARPGFLKLEMSVLVVVLRLAGWKWEVLDDTFKPETKIRYIGFLKNETTYLCREVLSQFKF